MKTVTLGQSSLKCSRMAYGCWRMAGSGSNADRQAGKRAAQSAWEAGYTLFDHADIYGKGQCESLFGEVLRDTPGMRESILIASKCGIRPAGDPDPAAPGRYDFSATHLEQSCEASLRRLGVETIDLYQLHRPDYLMNPTEVAEALSRLRNAGKIREVGVSNFRPSQVIALQKACDRPLCVNQVEISLLHRAALEDGTLDQCLAEGITPMAWSPLGGGTLGDGGKDLLPWQARYRPEPVLAVMDEVAPRYKTDRLGLALAWLLAHPAGIIPLVGSTHPDRVRQAVGAEQVALSREDWYRLLLAAMGEPLP